MRPLLFALGLLACGESAPAVRAIEDNAELGERVGAEAPEEAPESEGVSESAFVLEASGDLVLNALAMRSVRAAASEDAGYRALLDGYARSLEPGALTYLNLEMPLVDDHVELDGGWPRSRTERPRRAPILGASPALAGVLASLGVELVGLANNHALDQGHGGLRETLEALERAHVVHAGVGETASIAYGGRFLDHAGHRVAFLSATEPLNRRSRDAPLLSIARLDPEAQLTEAIVRAREHAELVIVAVHWSSDFVQDVLASQRHIAARLIEAGADIVLGTGPHVLQRVERVESSRGHALVAYSLGNLASGMGRAYRVGVVPNHFIHPANVRPEARDGVVLRVSIHFEETLRMEAEAHLLFTDNDWLAHGDPARVRVLPLLELGRPLCMERLASMRGALGSSIRTTPSVCPTD